MANGINAKSLSIEFVNCVRFNFFNRKDGKNSALVWCFGKEINENTTIDQLIHKIKRKDLGCPENPTEYEKERYPKQIENYLILSFDDEYCDPSA